MGPEDYPDRSITELADAEREMERKLDLEEDEATVYQQFMAINPGSTPEQAEASLYALMADYGATAAGSNPKSNSDLYRTKYQAGLMHFLSRIPPSASAAEPTSSSIESLKKSLPSRQATKNVTWSEEEHKLFLMGMDVHGKGDWKSISQHFVQSRTPSQIASHAQKYFKRLRKCLQMVGGFITKNRLPQQLGYPLLKTTSVHYSAEIPVPLSELQMPINEVNEPSCFQ